MRVSCPVISQILRRNSFKFDLMLFPILFSCFGINDLGVVELWSCRKDSACDLWGELTDGESPTRTGYKFGCHGWS